jgi:hypothetical protein
MSGISTFVEVKPEGPVLMEQVEVNGRTCHARVTCTNCGEVFRSQEEPMWVRPKNHSRANGNMNGKVPVHVLCALAANVGAVQDEEFNKEFARRKRAGAPVPDFRRRMR